MLALLRAWVASENRAAIVTLHDPALALNSCHRLLLMADGGILGIIEPQNDDLDTMERLLSRVYGPVSLRRCENRRGETQIVMLREEPL